MVIKILKGVIYIKKIIVSIILVLFTSIFVAGCTSPESTLKSPKEPPEIKVTIGDKEIDYVVAKNIWNNAIYDREGTFQTILKKGFKVEIPYVELGKSVMIDFKKYPPDKLIISDILLNEDGNKMYPSIEIISFPAVLKNGKCSFEINKNMETLLDSNWEPGKTYNRGFSMIATWGENECEYAFIIRTDSY